MVTTPGAHAVPAGLSLPPPPEVVRQYNELVQDSQRTMRKIAELEMERNEHKLVEETLQPLESERRAYRMVGEVLVERTVGEVLPSVTKNRENVRFLAIIFDRDQNQILDSLTFFGTPFSFSACCYLAGCIHYHAQEKCRNESGEIIRNENTVQYQSAAWFMMRFNKKLATSTKMNEMKFVSSRESGFFYTFNRCRARSLADNSNHL